MMGVLVGEKLGPRLPRDGCAQMEAEVRVTHLQPRSLTADTGREAWVLPWTTPLCCSWTPHLGDWLLWPQDGQGASGGTARGPGMVLAVTQCVCGGGGAHGEVPKWALRWGRGQWCGTSLDPGGEALCWGCRG